MSEIYLSEIDMLIRLCLGFLAGTIIGLERSSWNAIRKGGCQGWERLAEAGEVRRGIRRFHEKATVFRTGGVCGFGLFQSFRLFEWVAIATVMPKTTVIQRHLTNGLWGMSS
jgi:hypothetical protein